MSNLETLAERIALAPDRTPHVVDVEGELIVGTRQAFKQRILDLLAGNAAKGLPPRRRFVFDFSNCGYIDSSGLGVLVSIAKKISEANGGDTRTLVLCGLNEDLKTLFELSNIATLFAMADTREQAEWKLNARLSE